jgi:hypothetical protein
MIMAYLHAKFHIPVFYRRQTDGVRPLHCFSFYKKKGKIVPVLN